MMTRSRTRRIPAFPSTLSGAARAVAAALTLGVLLLAPAAVASAQAVEPVPIIGVDEVERGMTGYGMSVFAGTEPERFEVEVVGVMRNTAPDTSFILARLSGHNLENSGVAAGMSGSPVYIDGRLAGAVAFAWPFSQEAIAGITPIAKMRQLAQGGEPAGGPGSAVPPVSPTGAAARSTTTAGPRGPALSQPPVPLADLVAGKIPADLLEKELARLMPQPTLGAVAGVQWAASGFGDGARQLLSRGLGPVAPMGSFGSGSAVDGDPEGDPASVLVPGGAVAAVLVDGDLRLAATGTVTDRTGDQVLAFGHPFLGLGPLDVPMATAEVVTVLASDYSSFKISNMGPVVGAFEQDRSPGIYGRLGQQAAMIPVTVRVDDRTVYNMRVARVPQLTPALLAIATLAGLDSATYTGGRQGVDLTARFHLAGHPDLEIRQSFDGDGAAPSSAGFLLSFAGYLMGNDLAEVDLERVEVEVSQVDRPRTATLVGAHAERSVVRPGDTVHLNLAFSAWRGEDFRHRLAIELPEDLPRGRYHLFVGDGASVDAARLAVERSEPVTFHQALELMRSLHSRRELVVLGVAAGPGLAVAGEAMPNLPGSMRSIWSGSTPGGATPLRLAVSQQYVETMDVPLSGLTRIDLEVERREPLRGTSVEADGGDAAAGEPTEGGDTGGEPAVDGEATTDSASDPAASDSADTVAGLPGAPR